MKILITTDWYRPVINGVVTSVLNLTEQLEKRGHEVKVLTLSRNCHSYKEEKCDLCRIGRYGKDISTGKGEDSGCGERIYGRVACMEAGSDSFPV